MMPLGLDRWGKYYSTITNYWFTSLLREAFLFKLMCHLFILFQSFFSNQLICLKKWRARLQLVGLLKIIVWCSFFAEL